MSWRRARSAGTASTSASTNGVAGEVDLEALIDFEGVFAPLRALDRFAELHVAPDLGTICWPNGADIAPETLYDAVLQGQSPTRAAG